MRPTRPLAERFWEKVDKTTTPDGCWIWTACKRQGQFQYGYLGMYVGEVWKRRKAAIVSWELAHGKPFPEGMLACHTCDNPICVRPDHIYVGTKKTNWHDCLDAGRHAFPKGEDNYKAILTWEQIREIRNLYSSKEGFYRKTTMSQRKLAAKFGVSRRTIRAVLSHQTWKEKYI